MGKGAGWFCCLKRTTQVVLQRFPRLLVTKLTTWLFRHKSGKKRPTTLRLLRSQSVDIEHEGPLDVDLPLCRTYKSAEGVSSWKLTDSGCISHVSFQKAVYERRQVICT